MKPLPEIDAVAIFEETQQEFISLIKSLSPEELESATSSSKWNVKDTVLTPVPNYLNSTFLSVS